VAAFTTWVAVRAADRPADRNHPYGHGKIKHRAQALAADALHFCTDIGSSCGRWHLVRGHACDHGWRLFGA